MIDWFASKVGLLIFIVVVIGVLIYLTTVQLGIQDETNKMQTANDLARTIDGICEGCKARYSFQGNYSIQVSTGTLVVDGLERPISSSVAGADFTGTGAVIEKVGGVVSVSEA